MEFSEFGGFCAHGSLMAPSELPEDSLRAHLRAPSELPQRSLSVLLRAPSELREGSLEAPSMLCCQLKAHSSLRARR